jgi:hypothetical protein
MTKTRAPIRNYLPRTIFNLFWSFSISFSFNYFFVALRAPVVYIWSRDRVGQLFLPSCGILHPFKWGRRRNAQQDCLLTISLFPFDIFSISREDISIATKVSAASSDKKSKAMRENNRKLAAKREVETVLAIATNFMAFYLAAVLLERTGILCSVTVFLVTAFAGTIITSMMEKSLWPLLSSVLKSSSRSRAVRPAKTPLS